jgi:hypothetical protein
MTTGDWVFVSVYGTFGAGAMIYFIVWAIRRARQIRADWNSFWHDFGRMFEGNN